MPNRRFDWHEHIKDIEGEYRAARIAVDRLQARVRCPGPPEKRRQDTAYLRDADRNLEGTYLVRLFAAFEAALRSYDRARPPRPDAHRRGVSPDRLDWRPTRAGNFGSRPRGRNAVRLLRNYWVHKNETMPAAMTLAEARAAPEISFAAAGRLGLGRPRRGRGNSLLPPRPDRRPSAGSKTRAERGPALENATYILLIFSIRSTVRQL